jgi:hypothetical protein
MKDDEPNRSRAARYLAMARGGFSAAPMLACPAALDLMDFDMKAFFDGETWLARQKGDAAHESQGAAAEKNRPISRGLARGLDWRSFVLNFVEKTDHIRGASDHAGAV